MTPSLSNECARLLAACPDHVWHAATLALLTGLRLGPAFQMSWEDVNFEKGLISLRSKGRGGGKITPVGITPELEELLDEISRNDIGTAMAWKGKRVKSIKTA